MARIFYPTTFGPAARTAQAAANPPPATALSPPSIAARPRKQSDGCVLPSGKFTTTNTTRGQGVFSPETTRKVFPQHPRSDNLPPGRFATTNTQFGGGSLSPDKLPGPPRHQPPGPVWTTGAFTTTNTKHGGGVFAPAWTWLPKSEQPRGDSLPDGRFTTTNTRFVGQTLYPNCTNGVQVLNLPREVYQTFPVSPPSNTKDGGSSIAPTGTRIPVPEQLQGVVLPPGVFAGAAAPTWFATVYSDRTAFKPAAPGGGLATDGRAGTSVGWIQPHQDRPNQTIPRRNYFDSQPAAAVLDVQTPPWIQTAVTPQPTAPHQPAVEFPSWVRVGVDPNTQFGGDVYCPFRTWLPSPQQPPGYLLPPGVFEGVVPPPEVLPFSGTLSVQSYLSADLSVSPQLSAALSVYP